MPPDFRISQNRPRQASDPGSYQHLDIRSACQPRQWMKIAEETPPLEKSSPPKAAWAQNNMESPNYLYTAAPNPAIATPPMLNMNGGEDAFPRKWASLESHAMLETTDQRLQAGEMCDCCDEAGPEISYCNVCSSNLCDACWSRQAAHRKQRLAPGKIPHEKTNAVVAKKIQRVLVPASNEAKRKESHEADEQTAWFGIERPDGDSPIFQDYGRYAALLSATEEARASTFQTTNTGRDSRTPSLVSFVGQTGAGKSTLIKLLIDLNIQEGQDFRTPVVGASGINLPTSEDVHLYSDPLTVLSETPVFFADCEGLQGGEREPLGAIFKRSRKKIAKSECTPLPTSERELPWASSTSLASREYAVTNLYPRLLYTFSDVIVFVLRNPRVIESVFEQLVNWAAAALEMSSNQPVLPHAIIALNASENDIESQHWNPDFATESLFESISRTVFRNPTFKKYAQEWRERKKEIESVKQLMEMYYSSIKVVRIPAEGRPQLIEEQIGKLYEAIHGDCAAARERKNELRMLLDAEELQSYLQCAFDHFAHSLDRPFDFVQASFSNSPIPLDFGGNILKLAINLMHVWENMANVQMIFQELSYMVASCIMLDSTRHKIPGTAAEIFPQYLPHLDAALENFCEKHWPCEYVQTGKGLRCVNVRSGHGSKGHQLKDGKVFAVGEYQSQWSFETLQEEFRCNSYFRLEELLQLLRQKMALRDDEQRIAAEIHRDDVMAWFYRHVSGHGQSEQYNSHTVCFCCLSEPPEHALPCGHVLCSQCIRTYGEKRSKTEIEMQGCPLETQTTQLYQSWRIHLKPESAGVRVLTLDGGGIRGIVELEILRQIEREMNDKIRIQCFFDLVVGTSTGGIIALGLVDRNWPVQTCIQNFEGLCQKAFTRRTGSNLPGLGWFIDNFNHSKYETKSINEALKAAFPPNQYLFGGRRGHRSWSSSLKVAVTATIASSSAVVLANYNRRCDEKLSYHFQRPEDVRSELQTWEAARATSAAPRFFKSFYHEPSKQVYMDGGLCHNNPIRIADKEWKLLWGSELCEQPDIILSLGTAYNPHTRRVPVKSRPPEKLGILNHGKSLVKLAKNHIEESLDCDKIWRDYVDLQRSNTSTSRFVRYNIPLMKDLPVLDDVHNMQQLQQEVREHLARDQHQIKSIAMRLIATSFYWETERLQQYTQEKVTSAGRIYCRIAEGSREIRALGKLIQDKSYVAQQPFFLVQENGSGRKLCERVLSPDILCKMIHDGRFEMRTIDIKLENRLSETEIIFCLNENQSFPISGFPRRLSEREKDKTKTLHPQFINSRRWAGRSNSQQSRRNLWSPPERGVVWTDRNITNYSSPDHVIGHATADELNRATDQLSYRFATELDSTEIARPVAMIPSHALELDVSSSRRHSSRSFRKTPVWPWRSSSEHSHNSAQELGSSPNPVAEPEEREDWPIGTAL